MSLSDKIREHTKKQKKLYLPYLWDKWGVEPAEFTEALCEVWHLFENPRMVDNLLCLEQHQQPNLYEVSHRRFNRGASIHKKDYWKYCLMNQKEDQHVSVFSHDEKWVKNYEETGSVSCRDTVVGTDFVYLELDRETLEEACQDALKFYLDFPFKERCSLWYSGNKSIHIQIDSSLFGKPMGQQHNLCGRGRLVYNLAHKLAGDLRHDNGIVDPWSMRGQEVKEVWEDQFGEKADTHKMKQTLENIDPNLYTTNSLIRQPYSYHEKGKGQKKELNVEELVLGFKKDQKNVDIKQKNSYINSVAKPYLIHWFYECFELRKTTKHYIPDVDEGEIIKTFSKAFKYFDPNEANQEGWVNGLYSIFYENDTNPSVSVNIKNGWYIDFGHQSHNFSFAEVKEKIKNNNI